MLPLIIINFKGYESAVGANAVKLAKIAEAVSKETKVPISLAVQAADIYPVAHAAKLEVFAQHVDAVELGAATGSALPESAKAAGAIGSLVNHAEKRIPPELVEKTVLRLKLLGMKSVVCARDAGEAEKFARFAPDYIAYEPPELIGGKVSVSTVSPNVIHDTVMRVKAVNPKVQVLAGAGVNSKKDVTVAMSLGAAGMLLASHVTKAKDPKEAILGLVK